MTEVAFHFNVEQTLPYVCRLLRKAVNAGARVLVLGDAETLHTLDRNLWTFAPLEFVAHCTSTSPPDMLAVSPVVLTQRLDDFLGHTEAPALQSHGFQDFQVVLNLGVAVPQGFERFARLIEVVSLDEADRQAARTRWKTYAGAGHTLTRHDIATAR